MDVKNVKGLTAEEIVMELREREYTYDGNSPRYWTGSDQERVYFGHWYVTLKGGVITNHKSGSVRALTVGDDLVEYIADIVA